MSDRPRVALVDDDSAVLDALRLYLDSSGLDVRCFSKADDCIEKLNFGEAFDCLVTDVRMPKKSGLELQKIVNAQWPNLPVILITGHGDIRMAVSAIKAGAFDFIEKPFKEEQLLAAVRSAAEKTRLTQLEKDDLIGLGRQISELSARQRQVMDLAVDGYTNKEIANKLEISPRTVETYRALAMSRTGAKNLADLVKISMRLKQAGMI